MKCSWLILASCASLATACSNENDTFLEQLRAQGGQYNQTADQFEDAIDMIEDGEDMISDGKSDVNRGRTLIEEGEESIAKGKATVQKGQLMKAQIETMMIRQQQPVYDYNAPAPATVPYPGY